MGTNAIGTAIAALEPVQIYASEHYCLDVKRWTCAAAPILDQTGTTLLGVIDVSGVKDTFHGHSLGLVIAAARQVEAVLASRERDLQRPPARELHGRLRALRQRLRDALRPPRPAAQANGRLQAAREQHGVQLLFSMRSESKRWTSS